MTSVQLENTYDRLLDEKSLEFDTWNDLITFVHYCLNVHDFSVTIGKTQTGYEVFG